MWFFKNINEEYKRKYAKQRNSCVSLSRMLKRKTCSNLNFQNISDNKTFWKAVKPFFTKKILPTKKGH